MAPCQKTHKHIPCITHSSVTKSNLRLDVHTHSQSYTLASEASLNTYTNTHIIHTNAQRHTVHTITPLGQAAQSAADKTLHTHKEHHIHTISNWKTDSTLTLAPTGPYFKPYPTEV